MKIHMVKKGDTLYNIAAKYGVSLDEVLKLNPEIANPDAIDVGMKVKIPGAQPAPMDHQVIHKHVVKQGDTLWKLSKAWGISLSDMIKANPQLKNPNVLLTGEVVNIPDTGEAPHGPVAEMSEMMGMPGMMPQEQPQHGGKVFTGPVGGKTSTAPIHVEKPEAPAPMPLPAPPAPVVEQSQVTIPINIEYEKHIDLFQQFGVPAVEAATMYNVPKMHEMPVQPMPAVQHAVHYPMQESPAKHHELTPCCDGGYPAQGWSPEGPGMVSPAAVGGNMEPWPCPPGMTPHGLMPESAEPMGPWGEAPMHQAYGQPGGYGMPGGVSPAAMGPGMMPPGYGYGAMPMGGAEHGMPGGVSPAAMGPGMMPPGYGYGAMPMGGAEHGMPGGVSPAAMGPGMMPPGYGYGAMPMGGAEHGMPGGVAMGPGMMPPGYGYGAMPMGGAEHGMPGGVSPAAMGPGMMPPGYGYGAMPMGGAEQGMPGGVSPATMGPGMMPPGYGYGAMPMGGAEHGMPGGVSPAAMGPGMMPPGYGYGAMPMGGAEHGMPGGVSPAPMGPGMMPPCGCGGRPEAVYPGLGPYMTAPAGMGYPQWEQPSPQGAMGLHNVYGMQDSGHYPFGEDKREPEEAAAEVTNQKVIRKNAKKASIRSTVKKKTRARRSGSLPWINN